MTTTYRASALAVRAATIGDELHRLTQTCDAAHKARTVRALAVARMLGVAFTPGFVEEYRRFEEKL